MLLLAGKCTTVHFADALVRCFEYRVLGEESGAVIIVRILYSKSGRTGGRWSQPAFDLGVNGGFFAGPDDLIRRAKFFSPEQFDEPLSEEDWQLAARSRRTGLG